MKLQRIYVDTSVFGGCLDEEFAVWSNGLLGDFRSSRLKPVVSIIVEAEIANAYEAVQRLYAEFLAVEPEISDVSQEAISLADVYQRRRILTPKYYDDSLHIAVATVAEVDVLVSWNFRHIVHFNRIRQFNGVNLEMGYKPIQIFSPREVTTYDDYDEA